MRVNDYFFKKVIHTFSPFCKNLLLQFFIRAKMITPFITRCVWGGIQKRKEVTYMPAKKKAAKKRKPAKRRKVAKRKAAPKRRKAAKRRKVAKRK